MKEKRIVIEIDSKGNVHAETFHMEGIDCVDEIHKLMKDLATLKSNQNKPEYYKNKLSNNEKVKISK
jgi:hypothetical protein